MLFSTVIILAILVVFNALLLFSFFLGEKEDEVTGEEKFNDFSIIIAAKNEEQNIGALCNSLQKLNYQPEHFEVIFVDDNSTDDTFIKIKKCAENFPQLKVLSAEDKEIEGKKGALQIGFDNAKNEIIVTTDADCILPVNWLRELNKKFLQGYDVVIGAIRYQYYSKFSAEYSAFESLRNRILIFGFANLGLPYSASGGNFAFKRSILENLGGYTIFPALLSGDDDLLVQIAKKQKAKITTLLSQEAIVETKAPESFKELLRQRSRHVSTSNYYTLTTKIILGLWHLTNIAAFFTLFLAFYNAIFLIPPIVKLGLDFLTIKALQGKFSYKFGSLKIVLLQIIYEILVPVYYIRGTFGKTIWK